MDKIDPITLALQTGVDSQVFPGAVLLVRSHGDIQYHQAVGLASRSTPNHPTTLHTVYDLASLTKPLATGTAILCLVQEGVLQIEQSIGSILQELHGSSIEHASIRDLLCHRSGLPAWRPYYERVVLQNGALSKDTTRQARCHDVLRAIAQEPLEYLPRTKSVYSDLGFILLGLAIEAVTQQLLSRYCAEQIFHPLNASTLVFREDAGYSSVQEGSLSDIAPTEQESWRGRLLQGEVHDGNAFVLGGVAGHAGLFGTAEAVSVISTAWLDACQGRSSFFDSQLVRQFTTRQGEPQDSSWALGWDTPSQPSSSGKYFSSSAFGHLGFTGTSIWIDPEVELEVIFLTNRVNPTRDNNKIRAFRPMIHDVIYEEVVGIKIH
ncbi:MAG: D-alanyl-D-alanine carboxypeptidase [Nitrospirales bacterium]|nr:MAG: D-alanyl-D-alanine carboxypeptidase [Nitrospirales bacterium]